MAISAEDVFRKSMTSADRTQARKRGKELIAQYQTLQQLRKARDLTQVELARALGKEQVAISQIEKRADMLLSTLRGYVEGMGGTLKLVVQFGDQDPVVLKGFGGDEPEVPARLRRLQKGSRATICRSRGHGRVTS